jgi:hypothetical protein
VRSSFVSVCNFCLSCKFYKVLRLVEHATVETSGHGVHVGGLGSACTAVLQGAGWTLVLGASAKRLGIGPGLDFAVRSGAGQVALCACSPDSKHATVCRASTRVRHTHCPRRSVAAVPHSQCAATTQLGYCGPQGVYPRLQSHRTVQCVGAGVGGAVPSHDGREGTRAGSPWLRGRQDGGDRWTMEGCTAGAEAGRRLGPLLPQRPL